MRDVSFACVKPLSIVTKSELGLPDCFNRFAVNCFMVQIRDSYHFGGMKILSSFGMVCLGRIALRCTGAQSDAARHAIDIGTLQAHVAMAKI